MTPFVEFDVYGFMQDGQFDPLVPVPGPDPDPDPSPYQTLPPFYQPFAETSFWKTPVGSGAQYLSLSDPRHLNMFPGGGVRWWGSNGQHNGNWTERIYYATENDPLSEVRHYAGVNVNAGGQNPAYIFPPTVGTGRLYWAYKGFRVPTDAQWYTNSNTDRKCIVVMDFDCELTVEQYNASSQLIGTTQESYPRGTLAVEMHRFTRTSGDGGGGANTLYFTSNLGRADLLTHGGGYGPVASGVSITQGYIRAWEHQTAMAGDYTAIRHALKLGVPGDRLYGDNGPIWPASNQDGAWASTYSGLNPMGTMVVLDKDLDINSLAYSGTVAQRNLQKAIAWTMQNFGGYVLILAGSNGSPIKAGFEAQTPFVSNADAEEVFGAGKFFNTPQFQGKFRIVSNSNPFSSGVREAPDPSLIAGGGTRITAGKALPGFDNSTGLMLPINPSSESWYINT